MSRDEAYGGRAASIYAWMIDPMLSPLRRRISCLCSAPGIHSVLDIACATGAQCRSLRAAGLEPTGVDLSGAMIESARRRSAHGIRYIQASALALPFESDVLDAAILSLALHEHSESEREGMLREATRVIRPGGLLLLADYHRPGHSGVHPAWLAIRAIEHAAGGEHAAGFRGFMADGGLDGFARRFGVRVRLRRSSHGGAIGIIAADAVLDPVKRGGGG